jgi:FtsZ-interacting cell division protein ZipA
MNEDYLWDKSGQPDPQIQELEEILGTLRYQPKPLVIPRDLVPARRRNYFPLLAIAATVLVALLATGIWLQVRTSSKSQPQQAKVSPAVEEKTPPSRDVVVSDSAPANKPAKRQSTIAASIRRRHNPPAMKERDREEALAAKEQLMIALRVASEKLSLAHRKTHTTTPANQIKNQHRIG